MKKIYRLLRLGGVLGWVVLLVGCTASTDGGYDAASDGLVAAPGKAALGDAAVDLDRETVVNAKPYPNMFFQHYGVNPTIDTEEEPISTFSVDVDTASYHLATAYLERGAWPETASIRVEEFVNAFDYGYPEPGPWDDPIAVQAEAFPSPYREGYHVLHVGLKTRPLPVDQRRPVNWVFAVDVSGSMGKGGRIMLVRQALRRLLPQLGDADTVGIITFSEHARVLVSPTSPRNARLLEAIAALHPQGSTNASDGLALAYDLLDRHFDQNKIHRVILLSDGVANVNETDYESIGKRIEHQSRRGVLLTTIGVGLGNYNDVLMEQLAQRANGSYHYVGNRYQMNQIFDRELIHFGEIAGHNVKVQMVFDVGRVERYRLVGYENRQLTTRQFSDNNADAGEMGAGQAVTALYEVKLRSGQGHFGEVRVRFRSPKTREHKTIERRLSNEIVRAGYNDATPPARLSLVVAAFAEKLRGSYWVRNVDYRRLHQLYRQLPSELPNPERITQLGRLITLAETLDRRSDRFEATLPVSQMNFDHVPILQ